MPKTTENVKPTAHLPASVAATSKAPGANLSRLVSLVSCPPVISEGVRQETRETRSSRRTPRRGREILRRAFPGRTRQEAAVGGDTLRGGTDAYRSYPLADAYRLGFKVRFGEGRAPARPPSRTAQATGEGLSISTPLHGSNEDGAISARRSCGREALPLTRARFCKTHRFPEGRGNKRRQAAIPCGAVPRPIDLILLPMPIGSVSRCVSGRDVRPHVRRAGRRKPQGKDSPSLHLYTAQMRTAQSRRGGHAGGRPSL